MPPRKNQNFAPRWLKCAATLIGVLTFPGLIAVVLIFPVQPFYGWVGVPMVVFAFVTTHDSLRFLLGKEPVDPSHASLGLRALQLTGLQGTAKTAKESQDKSDLS